MTTKLTLTMDDHVIDSAKKYARKTGESLSGIVENYLKFITTTEQSNLVISDKVRKIMGVVSLPHESDYKKEVGSAIAQKYR